MTTIAPATKTCRNCGAMNEVLVVGSTSSFGYMDLDTRPAPLERETLPHQVERCDSCDYCAISLDDQMSAPPDVLNSDAYREQLADTQRPLLAREFACAGLLTADLGRYAEAGWLYLKSAWACDDAKDDAGAVEARTKALAAWEKGKEQDDAFAADEASELILLIEVSRRARAFEKAVGLCQQARGQVEELLADILEFEKRLIDLEDSACHSVGEVIEG